MQDNTKACSVCGKSRKAHYDNIYCYAATKQVNNTVYIFPIRDYMYTVRKETTHETSSEAASSQATSAA